MYRQLICIAVIFLAGCTHPIVITPDMDTLPKTDNGYIDATAGYYIPDADRALKVVGPGGGGDSVSYFPYKDLEPALQKVLFNSFRGIKVLNEPPTAESMKKNEVDYAFLMSLETESFSESALTWPPTRFTITLSCTAISQNGDIVWEKQYNQVGAASFGDFQTHFGMAGVRASQKAFAHMMLDLSTAPEFPRP